MLGTRNLEPPKSESRNLNPILKRGHPPELGEGRAFEVAKRAEVTRAADSPCTGPCTDWRPLLAGVGTRFVGPGGAVS
jgi:hypothetical protein